MNRAFSKIFVLLVIVLASFLFPAPGVEASPPSPPALVEVALELRFQDCETPREEGWRATVRLEPVTMETSRAPVESSDPSAAASRRHEVRVGPGQRPTVSLPPGTSWRVETTPDEGDGFGTWASSRVVNVPPASRSATEAAEPPLLELPIWCTAILAGVARPVVDGGGHGARAPALEELLVRVELPPFEPVAHDLPPTRFDCPVAEDGRFVCEVPATTLDVTLRADGFVPRYLWGLALEPGSVEELGTVRFQPGASVAGWVTVEEGLLEPGRARALLRRAGVVGGGSGRGTERARRPGHEVRLDERGFFQIAGVAPGAWELTVEHPGYSPARVGPIEIVAPVERRLLEPLVLRRPLDLELRIDPPVDWLGEPWHLELVVAGDLGGVREEAWSGTVPVDGVLVLEDRRPGLYRVSLADALGNGLLAETWSVDGPADAVRWLEVEMVPIEGTVRRGDEPLASARLGFGGRTVRLSADEDGRFEGVLPRAGAWIVAVESTASESTVAGTTASESTVPAVATQIPVTVPEPGTSGVSSFDIVVPDGLVHGRVVDRQGAPVAGARVEAVAANATLHEATSGPDGAFELPYLPEGTMRLSARLEPPGDAAVARTSPTVTVDVAQDSSVGPVVLRLAPRRTVAGTVTSPGRPVAGGLVLVEVEEPFFVGQAVQTRTEIDGRFEVSVPDEATSVVLTVSPPGLSLTAHRRSLPPTGSIGGGMGGPIALVLPVGPEAGTVELVLGPDGVEAIEREGAVWLLFQGDRRLPSGALLRWARGHGAAVAPAAPRMVFPRLAPGPYTACLGPIQVIEAWQLPAWREGARCASGDLAPGGRLVLDPVLSDDDRSGPGDRSGPVSGVDAPL